MDVTHKRMTCGMGRKGPWEVGIPSQSRGRGWVLPFEIMTGHAAWRKITASCNGRSSDYAHTKQTEDSVESVESTNKYQHPEIPPCGPYEKYIIAILFYLL